MSVITLCRAIVHGQVHHIYVVLMGVAGGVVVMMVVVVVEEGQWLQGGHVRGWGDPVHDHLVVHPTLRWTRWIASAWGHKQGGLYRLRVGRGLGVWWVFRGRADARPLGFS